MGSSQSNFAHEDIRERYQIGKLLGRGSFGEVRECCSPDSSESYAVKIVEIEPDESYWSSRSIFKREVEFLRSLDHPNVVRFVGAYQDKRNMYIVTEKCTGGEVFERLCTMKKFAESEVVTIARQVLRAIEYVHLMGIIHRDVKAENFLFTADGGVKLIDFGLAVRLAKPDDYFTSVVGSAHYLAPEMVRQRYSKPVDVWSAGVMVFLMLFGRYPFDGADDEAVVAEIKRCNIPSCTNELSVHGRQFLHSLLERNSKQRTTASSALTHPFLQDPDEAWTEASSGGVRDSLCVTDNDSIDDLWIVAEQTF